MPETVVEAGERKEREETGGSQRRDAEGKRKRRVRQEEGSGGLRGRRKDKRQLGRREQDEGKTGGRKGRKGDRKESMQCKHFPEGHVDMKVQKRWC